MEFGKAPAPGCVSGEPEMRQFVADKVNAGKVKLIWGDFCIVRKGVTAIHWGFLRKARTVFNSTIDMDTPITTPTRSLAVSVTTQTDGRIAPILLLQQDVFCKQGV